MPPCQELREAVFASGDAVPCYPKATSSYSDAGVVLCVLPSVKDCNGAGGVAMRWKEYTAELQQSGFTTEIWSIDADQFERRIPRLVHPRFPNTLADCPSSSFILRLWSRLSSANQRRPVAVIMTDLFNNVPISLVCRAAQVPLVYSIHTDLSKLDGGPVWISNLSQRFASCNAAVTITTSPSFQTLLQSSGVTRCTRHYRPIPCSNIVQRFELLPQSEIEQMRIKMTAGNPTRKLLVYVGRWSLEKRMHLLVKCAPEDATLCFIGDGQIAETVMSWADEPRVVCLRGMLPREQLAIVYAAADWVVSASDFETFGNVPFEAAHVGTPALLQNAQGFVDQIDKQENRGALIYYDAPDGAQQLSAAMERTERLLSQPAIVRKAAVDQSRQGYTISSVVHEVMHQGLIPKTTFRVHRYWFVFVWTAFIVSQFCSSLVSVFKGLNMYSGGAKLIKEDKDAAPKVVLVPGSS